jgi:hypothetical protein
MKKTKRYKIFLFVISVLTFLIISNCEKNTSSSYANLIGTWISSDLADTIEFRTENDFYKTVGIHNDHFNYSLSKDFITIQYNGVLKVLIQPTNHEYSLTGDKLIINLKNCYGFRSDIITFSKK